MNPHRRDPAFADASTPTCTPPAVAIASGKGGVGKTVLAINLAIQLGRAGYRPLLVDLDPGLANCAVHLRLSPARTLEDVHRAAARPEECLVEGPGGLRLLPGGVASDELAALDRKQHQALLQRLQPSFPGHGLVLLDNGAGIGPGTLAAIQQSDLLLLVTTPDPGALTDAYALLKVMDRQRIATPRALCVNRVRNRDEALRAATRLGQVTARFLHRDPPELVGWLSEHPDVELSVRRQTPLVLTSSGLPLQDLRSLAAGLLGRLPAARRMALRPAGGLVAPGAPVG